MLFAFLPLVYTRGDTNCIACLFMETFYEEGVMFGRDKAFQPCFIGLEPHPKKPKGKSYRQIVLDRQAFRVATRKRLAKVPLAPGEF